MGVFVSLIILGSFSSLTWFLVSLVEVAVGSIAILLLPCVRQLPTAFSACVWTLMSPLCVALGLNCNSQCRICLWDSVFLMLAKLLIEWNHFPEVSHIYMLECRSGLKKWLKDAALVSRSKGPLSFVVFFPLVLVHLAWPFKVTCSIMIISSGVSDFMVKRRNKPRLAQKYWTV